MLAPPRTKVVVSWKTVLPVLLVLCLLAAHFFRVRNISGTNGLTDTFGLLKERGYVPNPGFSGVFRPGTIIQISERGSDGNDTQLRAPLPFAWSDECFPGKTPRNLEFSLPNSTGGSSAGLAIDGSMVTKWMPSLSLQNDAASNYSLSLENTRIQAFAKGDLSENLAATCVQKLKNAIQAGDKTEWFQVVMESVTAESLQFHVLWKDNASATVKREFTNKITNSLAQTAQGSTGESADRKLKIDVTDSSSRQTEITAKGEVVFAYRARTLEPVTDH